MEDKIDIRIKPAEETLGKDGLQEVYRPITFIGGAKKLKVLFLQMNS